VITNFKVKVAGNEVSLLEMVGWQLIDREFLCEFWYKSVTESPGVKTRKKVPKSSK
jgi:hypothetical protein